MIRNLKRNITFWHSQLVHPSYKVLLHCCHDSVWNVNMYEHETPKKLMGSYDQKPKRKLCNMEIPNPP